MVDGLFYGIGCPNLLMRKMHDLSVPEYQLEIKYKISFDY